MALAFDAQGSADAFFSSPTSPQNFTNLTIGSGSNRAVVFTVALDIQNISGLALTWDNGGTNQSCTHINTFNCTGGNGQVQFFGLVAPTSGNKTLQAAWSGGTPVDFYMDGVSYTGADQTGGTTTFYNSTSSTANSAFSGTTLTVSNGDAGVDCMIVNAGFTSQGSPSPGTQVYNDGSGSSTGSASQRAISAGTSIAFSWSAAGSGNWIDAAVAVKAAVSSIFPPFLRRTRFVDQVVVMRK